MERAQAEGDRREAEKAASSKKNLRETLVRSASKHMDLAVDHGADAEKYIGLATESMRLMFDQAAKARNVAMIEPVTWPRGGDLDESNLENLIRGEMYRHAQFGGEGVRITGFALPGAAIGSVEQTTNPQAAPPLSVKLKEITEAIKGHLRGKLPK